MPDLFFFICVGKKCTEKSSRKASARSSKFYTAKSPRHNSGTNMTGRPGDHAMEMDGGSTVSYLTRTPRVPLFMLVLIGLEAQELFRLPGAAGDHFHCTVEPSPGHIRCRIICLQTGRSSQIWSSHRPSMGTRLHSTRDLLHFGKWC